MNAESIRIESDDRGFELHIDTTDDGTIIVNVHGVAEELYDAVKGSIGPWLQEGEAARRSMPARLTDAELEEEVRCAALGTEGPNAKQYRYETWNV